MCTFLFPRHFDDFEIPKYNETYIYSTQFTSRKIYFLRTESEIDEDEYYVHWLADHLPKKFNNIHNNKTLNFENKKNRASILGHDAWYHYLYYVEPFEVLLQAEFDYEQAFNYMKQEHDEIYKNENNLDSIEPLEEWINPKIWSNALREFDESKNIKAEHSDIGYRKKLAELLYDVREHNERYKILLSFYYSYNEEASK